MLLYKMYTLEFEFGRHLEHIVSYQGMQSGLSVFLVGEFGQDGHTPGKHGKPGKLREFEKLSKSQGNLNFCRKNLEISGNMKKM